jgi:hypothetical protein
LKKNNLKPDLIRRMQASLQVRTEESKNVRIKIYKTVILPVVLYSCEARPHTLARLGYVTNIYEKWCKGRVTTN